MPQTGMEIGYARVSTADQNLAMQLDAFAAAGIPEDRVYQEFASGVKSDRPQLAACMKALRPGDTLVVWKLDRLSRDIVELVGLPIQLRDRNIGLRSLTENLDTATADGRVFYNFIAIMAQWERDRISERTRTGLAAARARGRRGGRKRKLTDKKWAMVGRVLLKDPTNTIDDVAEALDVARATVYREIKRDPEAQAIMRRHRDGVPAATLAHRN